MLKYIFSASNRQSTLALPFEKCFILRNIHILNDLSFISEMQM